MPIRTLLVEPDPTARKYLTQSLRKRGHTVKACPDGATAWRAHEKKPYDLAIVDWQLPDMDGLAFIQKIRSLEAGRAPIIMAIAAKEKPGDLEPLMAAGIDDFVSVPLYPPQMDIRLAIAERQIRSRAAARRSGTTIRPGNESIFSSILDMTYEGIISIDQSHNIVLFNKSAERIFGYRADEALGQPLEMLLPDQFRGIHGRHVTQFVQEGPEARYMGARQEIEGQRKDGTRFPAEASISRVELGGEQVLTVVLRDMTQRKAAEQALRANASSLAEAQRIAHLGNWDWDIITRTLSWSDEIYRIYGLDPQEFDATYDAFLNAVHPDDREFVTQSVNRALEGETYSIDHRVVLPTGETRHVHELGEVTFDEHGQPVRMVGTVQDITERKRAEEALRERETNLRALAENANDGILVSTDGAFVFANQRISDMLGYSPEDIHTLTLKDLVHPDEYGQVMDRFRKRLAGKAAPVRYESTFIPKSGQPIPVEVTASSTIWRGEPAAMVMVRDITERKQAGNALAAERELLATTLKSIGEGVIATDLDGHIVLINHAAAQLTGCTREEALHRPIRDVLKTVDEATDEPVAIPPSLEAFRQQGMLSEDEAILVSRDEHRRPISSRVTPLMDKASQMVGMVVTFRDITERRRFEEEVLKAEKLESLGVLASGLAHDFNNFLMNIMLNVSTARMQLPEGTEVQELLQSAEQAVKHAKGITRQLLTFTRGGRPIKSKLPLAPLLKESVKFSLHGSSVRPKFQFDSDIWAVHIDPDQITQVINNLSINAVQAMPQGGQLHVSASNYQVDSARRRGPLDPGRYVEVTIRDEGVGIPPDIFDKIFDPYFTTKQAGSGLGLYSCFNILSKHSGWITAASEAGNGTTFTFYLPAVNLPDQSSGAKETIPRGSGRILIMDDDEGIRLALDKLLTRMGYDVSEAPEGGAALEAYQASQKEGRPFDVVILDLTVAGGHGGLQTFQELRELNPAIKAIVASGYSTDPVMAKYEEYGFAGVLSKPFSAEELGKTLHDVLAAS